MVSPRFKHSKFLGTPDIRTVERREGFAKRVVGKQARFGKRIILQQASTVPNSPKEAKLLTEVREQIQRIVQNAGLRGSAKLERLLSVQRVLQESIKLRQINGGRDPHCYQVLGSIALIYGFNSKELIKAANAMHAIENRPRGWKTWEGNSSHITTALKATIGQKKENLPSAIEGLLSQYRLPLTSKEIALKIKIDFSKSMNYINSSMQLLETTMYVKKLPLMVDFGTNSAVTVWVHKAYSSKLDPYKFSQRGETHFQNTQMEILNQLFAHNKPLLMTELYREFKGRTIGNPSAIYGADIVIENVALLEKAGLVTKTQIPHSIGAHLMGLKKGTGTSTIKLTELGEKIWKHATSTGTISEELRVLLLGEKTN